MSQTARQWLPALVAIAISCVAGKALAVDGEVLIDQERALQGGVTPGDQPGFPITISQSGRYKLVGNLRVPASKKGIVVNADAVTIDFNGFIMTGNKEGWVGVQSREDSINRQRWLTVLNGTITGFASASVLAGEYAIVDSMRIVDNADGAWLGNFARISRSTIVGNGVGVGCGSSCLIESNIISSNGGQAGVFMASGGGTVLGNTITENAGYGIFVIPPAVAGFGNNTLSNNNKGGSQVNSQIHPLQPNYCQPKC
jgi:hypothetical protein